MRRTRSAITLAALMMIAVPPVTFAQAPRPTTPRPTAPRPTAPLNLAPRPQPRPQAKAPALFQHHSVDEAWQAATKARRPMLLFISSENCPHCVRMEKETYSNPQIAAALAANCETVSVMMEDNPELIKRLRVRAYPTTIVVAPNGKELVRVQGFLEPRKFAERMFQPPKPQQTAGRPNPRQAAAASR